MFFPICKEHLRLLRSHSFSLGNPEAEVILLICQHLPKDEQVKSLLSSHAVANHSEVKVQLFHLKSNFRKLFLALGE